MEENPKTLAHALFSRTPTIRLPESVMEMAKDADEIWHLGDLCAETILDELRSIGPAVIVVRGNCDSNFEWPVVVDLCETG